MSEPDYETELQFEEYAREALDSGAAAERLDALVVFSQETSA